MAETKDKTAEEAPPQEKATEETSPAQDEEVEGTQTRLEPVETEEKAPRSRARLWKFLAVVVFAGVTAAAYLLLKDGLVAEEPVQKPAAAPKTTLDPSLEARELLRFGEEALQRHDTKRALELFEAARQRADLESPDDINLTVDIYDAFARLEAERGNAELAELYREYIRSKQNELGESLPLFNQGEKLFREGKHVEARQFYARFLLLAGILKDNGKRYIEIARRRIADSYEMEYKARYASDTVSSLTNPEGFFHEG